MRIFLIGLLLLVYGIAQATDINWVHDGVGNTYYSELSGTTAAPTVTGSEAVCYDDNTTTYYGGERGTYGTAQTVHMLFRATFSKPITVSQIKVVHAEYTGGPHANSWSWDWTVRYYDDTGWHTQGTDSGTTTRAVLPASPQTNDYTGLNLKKVTVIEYYGNAMVGADGTPPPPGPSVCGVYLNELYTYGHEAGGGYAMIY